MATTRVEHVLDRVRQPEYTGENRCIPCTVTNVAIAVVLSAAVGYGAFVVGGGMVGATVVGGGLFVLSLASIYFRGYLVPGTPELTKRYFPDWLLAYFDKAERPREYEVDEEVDVERVLWEADVLEEKPHGDLGVTESFAAEWWDAIEQARDDDTGREALADIIGVDADEVDFQEYGSAFVAFYGDYRVGRWESRAAFLADAGGGRVLPDYYDDWEVASPAARGQILAGLRLFLEECPSCDGQVRFGQEVVESCCRSYDVIAVTCDDCNSRLFEIDVTEEMLEGAEAEGASA